MNPTLYEAILKIDQSIRKRFFETTLSPSMSNQEKIEFSDFSKWDSLVLGQLAEGLRQAILTQVSGCAVTQVQFRYETKDGNDHTLLPVTHKYGYVYGIVESIREIIMNLQQAVLKLKERERKVAFSTHISCEAPVPSQLKEFLLGELFEKNDIDVINPDLKLFTLQDSTHSILAEITIEKDTGYRRAEQFNFERKDNIASKQDIFSISIDANFNPVKSVGFKLDNGQLLFSIMTNNSVSPLDAYKQGYEAFRNQLLNDQEAL